MHFVASFNFRPMPINQFRKYVATNDPIKFLIVRHPFDRLLSAYRDKLVSSQLLSRMSLDRFSIRPKRPKETLCIETVYL